jgi:hypothetical protein
MAPPWARIQSAFGIGRKAGMPAKAAAQIHDGRVGGTGTVPPTFLPALPSATPPA